MHPKIQSIQATRRSVIRLLETAGTEAANIIPPGFNNNIVWNFGHMLATQQMVNYSRAGLPLPLGGAVVNKYMRGTKPDGLANAAEIAGLIAFSDASLARLEQDFDAGVLRPFEPFTTPLGYTMSDVGSALDFINIHDAIHFGIARTMARLVAAL